MSDILQRSRTGIIRLRWAGKHSEKERGKGMETDGSGRWFSPGSGTRWPCLDILGSRPHFLQGPCGHCTGCMMACRIPYSNLSGSLFGYVYGRDSRGPIVLKVNRKLMPRARAASVSGHESNGLTYHHLDSVSPTQKDNLGSVITQYFCGPRNARNRINKQSLPRKGLSLVRVKGAFPPRV